MRPRDSQTVPPGGADPLPAERCRRALAEARERTLALTEPVSEEHMDRVHDSLMSPLVWDLGHIAAFEDLWLCQRAGGLDPLRPELSQVYDAAETPRAERPDAHYLRRDDALEYLDRVRERALGVLDRVDLGPAPRAPSRRVTPEQLNAGGFVWDMLIEHEHQHNETMLQTLQLAEPGVYAPSRRPLPGATSSTGPATVPIEPGSFPMGDDGTGFAYDNERPRHAVELSAFRIDRTPVTNAAFRAFVDDGGYAARELWTEQGWRWRCRYEIERPLYWTPDGCERRFERVRPVDDAMPVMHVSWFEADAYARWRGVRLPTEAEWEKAAAYDPATGSALPQPWGAETASPERATLDQLSFGPAPAGALELGASPCGALGLIGDCWEWTQSRLEGYPGFSAYPYRAYSQAFFGGDYRVMRGASWATRPSVARPTFRNWDLPQRRQIFVGFRCAATER